MAEFREQDLSGARFERVRLANADLERVDLSGASIRYSNLSRSSIRDVDLTGAELLGVVLENAVIDGDIEGLVVNGVEIAPLVEAELDRREPERVKMRPTDPAGFHAAWDIIERRWDSTVERARALDPTLLHESVNGEWSFIETLRHLLFATDSWIGRAVLGDTSPWHPLGLPFAEMEDTPGVPRDRDARPSLDEMLALRRERFAMIRGVIDGLTDEKLDALTEPTHFGWPPPKPYPVRQCLAIILNEEWLHRQFAERDLDVLAGS